VRGRVPFLIHNVDRPVYLVLVPSTSGGAGVEHVAVPVFLSAASSVVPILRPRGTPSLHDPCHERRGGSNENQRASHLSISGGSHFDLSVLPSGMDANHRVTALLERRRFAVDLAAQERRCPRCQGELRHIGEKISSTVDH